MLDKLKCESVVLTNGEDNEVVVTGYTKQKYSPGMESIFTLGIPAVESLKKENWEFVLNITIPSAKFAEIIGRMPAMFKIFIEHKKKRIVFEGTSDRGCRCLYIEYKEELALCKYIDTHPETQKYENVFKTLSINLYVTKAQKIADQVKISLGPILYLEYQAVQEDSGMFKMFIAPKIDTSDDDILGDDECDPDENADELDPDDI